MDPIEFDEWYDSYYEEWWKDKREELRMAWNTLLARGVHSAVIANVFTVIANAIQEQHE